MRSPRLLIATLALLLLLLLTFFFVAFHQRPSQGHTDINRGFPQTPTLSPQQLPEPEGPQTALPRTRQPNAAARTLYVEPAAGFDWLYTLVNTAQSSIDMTMYELIDPAFSGDLAQACARGVKVRVLLDQRLEKTRNTPAYTQLNSAGANCSATWSNPQFQATHEKSLIIDNKTAVILTANLVTRDYPGTRDFAVVEADAADIAAIEATFNADLGSTTDKGYQPAAGDDLIWSPTTAQPDLLGLINNATRTLLVENEEMGAPSIVNALAAACQRGVKVEIAMTNTRGAYQNNFNTLTAAGCGVHLGANNSSTLYIHAKAILADLGTATANGYLGSINFSNASMTQNRELGLYVTDPALLQQISAAIAGDYAGFPPG